MKITTNNNWRLFLNFDELTAAEQSGFDWMNEEEQECGSFFRYRCAVYSLSDFMVLGRHGSAAPKEFNGWDGYASDSFFSGVLIKVDEDFGDTYKVATYIS